MTNLYAYVDENYVESDFVEQIIPDPNRPQVVEVTVDTYLDPDYIDPTFLEIEDPGAFFQVEFVEPAFVEQFVFDATEALSYTNLVFNGGKLIANSSNLNVYAELLVSPLREGSIIFEPVSGSVSIDNSVYSTNAGPTTGTASTGSLRLRNNGSPAILRSTALTSSIEQWAVPDPDDITNPFPFPVDVKEFSQISISFDIKHSSQTQSAGIIFRAGTTGSYANGGTTPYWIITDNWITNDGTYRQFKLSYNDGTASGNDQEFILVGSSSIDWTQWHKIEFFTTYISSTNWRQLRYRVDGVVQGNTVSRLDGGHPLTTNTYQRMEFANNSTSDIWIDNFYYSRNYTVPTETYPSGYNWNQWDVVFDSNFNRLPGITQFGQAQLQSTSSLQVTLSGLQKGSSAISAVSDLNCLASKNGEIALSAFADAELSLIADKIKLAESELSSEFLQTIDETLFKEYSSDIISVSDLVIDSNLIRDVSAEFEALSSNLTLVDITADITANLISETTLIADNTRIKFADSNLISESIIYCEPISLRSAEAAFSVDTVTVIEPLKILSGVVEITGLFDTATIGVKTADINLEMFNDVSLTVNGTLSTEAVVNINAQSEMTVDAELILGIVQDLRITATLSATPFFTTQAYANLVVEGFALSTGAIYHIDEQVYIIPREIRLWTIQQEFAERIIDREDRNNIIRR